jgi:hypothetical protein
MLRTSIILRTATRWRFEKLVNPSTEEGHTVLGAVSIGLELCNYGFAGCSKDHLGRKSEP